jgi:hypothetical protein
MMYEEEKTYKLDNEEELTTTINAIAERWTEFHKDYVEETYLDGYEIADKEKWDGWWKWYVDDTADDIAGWIRDGYEITFDDDDDADADADDLEDDVYDEMTGKNGGHGFDDGYGISEKGGILEMLEKAGAIRKMGLSEEDVKNAKWTIRDNRSDEHLPNDPKWVYKAFEATINGHKYSIRYSKEFEYAAWVDDKQACGINDTSNESASNRIHWETWDLQELAEIIGRKLGTVLDALDPALEEYARRAIAYYKGETEEFPSLDECDEYVKQHKSKED